jgi:adenine-specific DNA-methyltransferase
MPELQFKGKEFVYNHHLTVPYHPLEMDASKSIGKPNLNGNLIIHGDNLHALKALLPLYAGKVDCIFIDPPYNTGNENWSYNDNVNSPMMREWLSSNPVTIEDGLRHDKWCAMMYPRLKLLYELLSDQGSFWMTIDDNEIHHARGVLDDVFGQERFIACVVWQKRTSPESRLRLGTAQDYILVYGNGNARDALRKLSITEEQEASFGNPDNDPRGAWTSTDFSAQGYRANQMYKITTPSGTKYDPPPGRCWGNVESEYLRLRREGRMWFGVKGDARPRIKTYLDESEGISAWTWWTNAEVGGNQESKKEVMRILGSDKPFDYPKPVRLLSRILAIATEKSSLILDSFAGSGTTAHAALEANAKDDGSRKFILVEGEDYADAITAERVRRVIKGYKFEGTLKEELFRKAISFTTLRKPEKVLKEIDAIANLEAHRFDKIKNEVTDGELVVTGEKEGADKAVGLGGEFTFCTLGEALDLDKILTGRTLPAYEIIGAWLFHTATGESLNTSKVRKSIWFLGESTAYHVWLVYKPDLDFLKSNQAALTLELAQKIASDPDHKGKRHLVFAPAKYAPNKTLLPLGVEYAPLPFALYRVEKD